ncbi:MAG: glycosyltransferase family 4 protein [Niabella sp.]
MKKIAIICQRYGLEVNGGAEYHARILAEQLSARYNVQVLTTTALDYRGWSNHYPAGEEIVNDVPVKRFPTLKLSAKKTRKARRAILKKKKYFKILRFLGLYNFFDRKFKISDVKHKDIVNWVAGQGPYCPDLVRYLKLNKEAYDVFIFFTYLYYPTVVGMPLVKEKAIFIPTAHDEPPLYTKPYEDLFAVPRFIMYNTASEKKLIESNFKHYTEENDIAGVGIVSNSEPGTGQIDSKYNYDFDYFIYIGRIDANKGCKELVKFFDKYSLNKKIKLVLVGKDFMDLKVSGNIIKTGFVSEKEKLHLLRNSSGLIIPSKYESLSMVTLEAMLEGKTVIVNGQCEVLKEHIINSDAGFYYENYNDFEKCLNSVLGMSPEDQKKLAEKSVAYVEQNYSWESILNRFDKAVRFITEK